MGKVPLKTSSISLFCLVIGLGAIFFFNSAQRYFDHLEMQVPIAQLHQQLNAEKQKRLLAEYRYQESVQNFAQLVPEVRPEVLAQKNLSEVALSTRLPASIGPLSAQILFKQSSAEFEKQNWTVAAQKLEDFKNRFPTSGDITQAQFMLAEAYLQLGKTRDFYLVFNSQLEHFPESYWTGLLIVRLTQNLLQEKKTKEASEMLSILESDFRQFTDLKDYAAQIRKTIQ